MKRYRRQERRDAHPMRYAVPDAMGRTGIAALALATALAGGQADIIHNKHVQAESNVSITVIAGALKAENNTRAILVLGGYGYRDADFLTEKIGPALQSEFDGLLWSGDYNDASLDARAIAHAATVRAVEQGVDELVLVGHSIGGVTSSQVAEVLTQEGVIKVTVLAPMAMPYGYEGLQPWRQDQLNYTGLLALSPDLVYSTPFQLATETVTRYESFTGENLSSIKFAETVAHVWDQVMSRDLPGTWLASDQMFTLQNNRLDETLASIADAPSTSVKPLILDIVPSGFDDTVNTEYSSERLQGAAEKAGLRYIKVEVEGLEHQRPWRAAEQLERALVDKTPEIADALYRNRLEHGLENMQVLTRLPVWRS